MVATRAVSMLLAFALLHGSMAATLKADAEKEAAMMRRENLAIGSKGEMSRKGQVNNPNDEHVEADFEDAIPSDADFYHKGLSTDDLSLDQISAMSGDFCDYDFQMGQDETNNCTEAKVPQEPISRLITCQESANRAGAATIHGKFILQGERVTDTDRMVDEHVCHPKGCYKVTGGESKECKDKAGADGVCYYFNDIGIFPASDPFCDRPNKLLGTPVCKRPMLQNGTKDTNGGCPEGYAVIDHSETCRQVAACWSIPAGDFFHIGAGPYVNASKHLDYPRGCFIDNEDGKLYYNPKSKMGVGTNVRGLPVCNVTSVVSWRKSAGGGKGAGGANGAGGGNSTGGGEGGGNSSDAAGAAPAADAAPAGDAAPAAGTTAAPAAGTTAAATLF